MVLKDQITKTNDCSVSYVKGCQPNAEKIRESPPGVPEYPRGEKESVWDVCKKFIDAGYVLHGSPLRLDVLEPKPARDASKKFGNDTAVFAVRSPASAIFSAIVDRSVLPIGADRRVKMYYLRETDARGNERVCSRYAISKALKEAGAIKDGWVHVLPPDTFIHDRDSSESKSYQSVRPMFVISVEPKDFPFEMHIF